MSNSSIAVSSASFDSELSKYTAERKQVSDRLYNGLHLLVLIMTLCAVAFAASYAVQLGETLLFKIIISGAAIGIECSLVFFAAAMYPKAVLKIFGTVAGVGVIFISIFTAMSFLLSQQYAADYKVVEMKKAYAEKLQDNLNKVDVSSTRNRGTVAAISNRIEDMFQSLEGHKGSKATAVYHYTAHALGYTVESVAFAVRLIWALVFVSTTIALASYLETIYSPQSLGKWMKQLKERKLVLVQAREDYEAIPSGVSAPAYARPVVHQVARKQSSVVDSGERYRRTGETSGDLSESIYQRVKQAVSSGAVKPTVANLKKLARGTERAYQAIDRLMHEGIIQQKSNGRYAVA